MKEKRNATVVGLAFAQGLERRIKELTQNCVYHNDARASAIKERDEAIAASSKLLTRITDLENEIRRLNHKLMELSTDARTSDQNTALAEEKYSAALEIIRIISGKESF